MFCKANVDIFVYFHGLSASLFTPYHACFLARATSSPRKGADTVQARYCYYTKKTRMPFYTECILLSIVHIQYSMLMIFKAKTYRLD